MRGSNPALRPGTFASLAGTDVAGMTVQGTINKTGLLILITMATAAWTWSLAESGSQSVAPLLLLGVLGGLGCAMATIFVKRWAPVTAPLYAALEGLVLGGVSALYNAASHGIAVQAVALTFGTLAVMLLAYSAGVIRVNQRFRTVIVAATGAIALFYVVSMALGFFGVRMPVLYSASPMGILFSVVVVIVAAMNLALDFDFIQAGAAAGAPRFMEWYGAFGVMVTLIWLYLEILRLLSKLRSR